MRNEHSAKERQEGIIMAGWRPEGWQNPYRDANGAWEHLCFERGADAMLAALRAKGHHVDRAAAFCSLAEHCTLSNKENTGNYLFIPDDPQPEKTVSKEEPSDKDILAVIKELDAAPCKSEWSTDGDGYTNLKTGIWYNVMPLRTHAAMGVNQAGCFAAQYTDTGCYKVVSDPTPGR